jgi:hypothetical protein
MTSAFVRHQLRLGANKGRSEISPTLVTEFLWIYKQCTFLLLPSRQLPTSPCQQLSANMMAMTGTLLAIASFFLPALVQSSSCSTTLTPTNSVQPSVASGYRAQLIATGLSSPRSIQFDKAGNLLVVEQNNGDGSVSALTLQDNGGTCLSVTSHTTLVTQSVRNTNSSHLAPPLFFRTSVLHLGD